MIVKILDAASSDYNAVRYNEKKIDKGDGELITMKNFPSHINFNSPTQDVRDYFISVSSTSKAKKPQFHVTISSRFREHTKEQLAAIGEEFMNSMGYGTQPYIIVFHNDTDNNHIHIVSTRIDRKTGRKISDSYERTKAQKAVREALKKLQIADTQVAKEKEVADLLHYRFTTLNQFILLLKQNGFSVTHTNEELKLFKFGAYHSSMQSSDINFKQGTKARRAQVKAILLKYKDKVSNTAFNVIDKRDIKDWQDKKEPKTSWESELKNKLREAFGLEIVFHTKDGQKPFGYTVIDHKAKTVWKGSELMRLQDLFHFTGETIDRKLFELVNEYNITNDLEKQLLLQFFHSHGIDIPSYMLFPKKRKLTKDQITKVTHATKSYLSHKKKQRPSHIHLLKDEKEFFVIDTQQHYIGNLRKIIGEENYRSFEQSVNLGKGNSLGKANKGLVDNNSLGNIALDMIEEVADFLTPDLEQPQTDDMDPRKRKRRKKRKR